MKKLKEWFNKPKIYLIVRCIGAPLTYDFFQKMKTLRDNIEQVMPQ